MPAHVQHLLGQGIDQLPAFGKLEIAHGFFHAAFEFVGGVGVAAIQEELERLRVAGVETGSPAGGDDQGGQNAVFEQVGRFAGVRGGLFPPGEGFVVPGLGDEAFTARRVIGVDDQRRRIGAFGDFKGVSEDQSEHRREQQQQDQYPPVTRDVEELLSRHAGDGSGLQGKFHRALDGPSTN